MKIFAKKTWLVPSHKVISFGAMKKGNRKSNNKPKSKNKNKNSRHEKSSFGTDVEESYESEYILAFMYLFLKEYDMVYEIIL